LVEKWARRLRLQIPDFRIKRMKTKWGSCSLNCHHVWLNLELIKKLPSCLDYVILHELLHFRERHHNDAFIARLDRLLPTWRVAKQELNAHPLAPETWN
jgi:predicted metal-dependent hydrolase